MRNLNDTAYLSVALALGTSHTYAIIGVGGGTWALCDEDNLQETMQAAELAYVEAGYTACEWELEDGVYLPE